MSFLFYERDLFGFESEIQRPMRGPKSGRVYRRKSVVHRASAPGEAPAIDTGILRFSIAVKIGDSGLSDRGSRTDESQVCSPPRIRDAEDGG